MSPCTLSGQADCTTFTDAVSMAPTPKPIRNRPGQKVQIGGVRAGQHEQQAQPDDGHA